MNKSVVLIIILVVAFMFSSSIGGAIWLFWDSIVGTTPSGGPSPAKTPSGPSVVTPGPSGQRGSPPGPSGPIAPSCTPLNQSYVGTWYDSNGLRVVVGTPSGCTGIVNYKGLNIQYVVEASNIISIDTGVIIKRFIFNSTTSATGFGGETLSMSPPPGISLVPGGACEVFQSRNLGSWSDEFNTNTIVINTPTGCNGTIIYGTQTLTYTVINENLISFVTSGAMGGKHYMSFLVTPNTATLIREGVTFGSFYTKNIPGPAAAAPPPGCPTVLDTNFIGTWISPGLYNIVIYPNTGCSLRFFHNTGDLPCIIINSKEIQYNTGGGFTAKIVLQTPPTTAILSLVGVSSGPTITLNKQP